MTEPINLRVVSQDGTEVFFKIKSTTLMGKLMAAYCTKLCKDQSTVRFLYNGSRVKANDTPESLDMEDGDVLDAMVEQVGGDSGLVLLPMVVHWRTVSAFQHEIMKIEREMYLHHGEAFVLYKKRLKAFKEIMEHIVPDAE